MVLVHIPSHCQLTLRAKKSTIAQFFVTLKNKSSYFTRGRPIFKTFYQKRLSKTVPWPAPAGWQGGGSCPCPLVLAYTPSFPNQNVRFLKYPLSRPIAVFVRHCYITNTIFLFQTYATNKQYRRKTLYPFCHFLRNKLTSHTASTNADISH